MNIGDLTKTIATIARDYGKEIIWTTEQLNKVYSLVNYDILKKKYGYPKDFHGAETIQQILDSLRILKTTDSSISLTLGEGDLPADYLHKLKATAGGRNIDFVTELEDGERESSPVRMASTRYPTATINNTKINVKPTSISTISLVYYKRPTTPVYAVTETNGILVYDAGSSTDFDWNDEHDQDIIRYTLEYMGITVRNEDILPYVQQKKMEEN